MDEQNDRRSEKRRPLFNQVVIQAFETGELIRTKGYDISYQSISVRHSDRIKGNITYIISVNINGEIFKADCHLNANIKVEDRLFRVVFDYDRLTSANNKILQHFIS